MLPTLDYATDLHRRQAIETTFGFIPKTQVYVQSVGSSRYAVGTYGLTDRAYFASPDLALQAAHQLAGANVRTPQDSGAFWSSLPAFGGGGTLGNASNPVGAAPSGGQPDTMLGAQAAQGGGSGLLVLGLGAVLLLFLLRR